MIVKAGLTIIKRDQTRPCLEVEGTGKPMREKGDARVPELQFKGKEFVYNHHLTVPFRPLETDATKGIGAPALDGNLIIHGDNLHALKALLPTHAGKVDCIFIDPPYNTGNEGWAYNDNVNSPMIREWLAANPIGLEDGLRHDKWACMMWPRLKLLHELLAEDGSLWMTLDDNEAHRAISILEEIFGPDQHEATIAWEKRFTRSNNASRFSSSKDWLIVFRKSETFRPNREPREGDGGIGYGNADNDPRGDWTSVSYVNPVAKSERPNLVYEIENPFTCNWVEHETNAWKFSPETNARHVAENRLWWGIDGNLTYPRLKVFLSDGIVPVDLWKHDFAGTTDQAYAELAAIMGRGAFETIKPTKLIRRVIELATKKDSLILDSFAGSGTTAHAVLAANTRDGGNPRFILVEGEDYADRLTAERVRRVINGYAFTGTQREELLREPITMTKLKQANSLLEQVQRIETLDGPRYDRIKSTVKDGALIVTGERDVKERTPGLGGGFTYCTLGAPIEMDAILTGKALPSVEAMAGLLWHTATAKPFDAAGMTTAPDLGDGALRLGEMAGRTYWLFYKPDLDWLKSADAALTLTRARAIGALPGEHLVFAPAKFVSRELLGREKLTVDYAPLPFALYRLETA